MFELAKNVVREKVRRKELYIIAGIALVLIVVIGSGNGSLTINGVPVTSFTAMLPILITVVNVVGCIMAIVLSVRTIPNEYERKTSHLVWVRGISQFQYHLGLTCGNLISSYLSVGILYLGVVMFVISKRGVSSLQGLIPAFLILCINVTIVSLLASIVSIVLPGMLAGVLVVAVTVVGVAHPLVKLLLGTISTVTKTILRFFLGVIPDLYEISQQSSKIIQGQEISIHSLFAGFLAAYLISILLIVARRKEA